MRDGALSEAWDRLLRALGIAVTFRIGYGGTLISSLAVSFRFSYRDAVDRKWRVPALAPEPAAVMSADRAETRARNKTPEEAVARISTIAPGFGVRCDDGSWVTTSWLVIAISCC